jgi:DNA topoisomerase-3
MVSSRIRPSCRFYHLPSPNIPGPCQYPTLGFVCDQYFRVQNFVPEQFWYIHVALERDGHNVQFKWNRGHVFDFEMTFVLYELCVENPEATVTQVKTKPTQKWSVEWLPCMLMLANDIFVRFRKPLPLTTVDLQKSGSRLLRLAPKRVLDVGSSERYSTHIYG